MEDSGFSVLTINHRCKIKYMITDIFFDKWDLRNLKLLKRAILILAIINVYIK